MDIQLFGPTEVSTARQRLTVADFGGVKHRRILQLLVLRRSLSKSELAELLWEGAPPAEYVATLESYVSTLRRRLDPDRPARQSVVRTRTGGYELDTDRVDADVWRFDRLVGQAATYPSAGALRTLGQAVALAERPLLADESTPSWAAAARHRYQVRLVQAATTAARHALDLGQVDLAHDLAQRATTLDPLAEGAWRTRMSARVQAGDRAGALRCYQSCRAALRDEMGVEPSPATSALYLQVLRADGPVPAAPAPTVEQIVAAVLAAARELAGTDGCAGTADPAEILLARTERLVRTGALAGTAAPVPAARGAVAARSAAPEPLAWRVPRPRLSGLRATA